jgi:two-component system phosphate regulon sensor histidine kinase PhoR
MWAALALVCLGSAAGIYCIAKQQLRPLEDLLAAAKAAASGNLDTLPRIISRDEIGRMSDCLNEILLRWKASLKSISREKKQLDAILTSMSDGVIAVDQVGRVVLINRAAREMLGLGPTDPKGRFLLETLRHHEVEAAVKTVLQDGQPAEREIRLHPASSAIYRLSVVPTFEERGRHQGAVLVLQDVTQGRQFEKMRSEFVANVSHELRTPLTSIKGFAETLRDGAVEDEGLRVKFLNIIIAEANRLHRLIDDLLTLSLVENRQVELKSGVSRLPQVVGKVVELLLPVAEAKGVAIAVELPEDLPPLGIHEDYLGQIILNLVDNAVKYTPAGGKVWIRAQARGGQVETEVSDTGIGIPAEALPRLFERFYRVDKARSRELGGTGLGLAIVKHLLDRHGGSIRVHSTPGKGSTFTFSLPVANPLHNANTFLTWP